MNSGLSSRPSSRNSSRPSSYDSSSQSSRSSQRSSYSSLPDLEPYTFGLNPRIVDYETMRQDPNDWGNHPEEEFSFCMSDTSFVDQSSYTYDNTVTLFQPDFSPAYFSFQPVPLSEPVQNLEFQTSTYSTFGSRLPSSQNYSYPAKGHSFVSNRLELGPDDSISSAGRSEELLGHCRPNPDYGKGFKDFKAHMLTHSKERPEKCPIVTCDYHVKGFCRKWDKNRHTLTHFKGTLVCSFCPGRNTAAAKTFQRADIFKRHLVSVHGAEHTPSPNSRKSYSPRCTIPRMESSACHLPGTYGKCSNCSAIFADAQIFYNHLDDCVMGSVLRHASSSFTNTPQNGQLSNCTTHMDKAEKSCDSDTMHRVINKDQEFGRKRGNDFSPSSGCPDDQMKMNKRVLCGFDGTRRLWRDETMLATDFDMSILWSSGASYITASDTQKPEFCFNNEYLEHDFKSFPYIDFPIGISLSMKPSKNF